MFERFYLAALAIIAAITLLSIGSRDPIRTIFAIVQPILQIAAIWFLFRPDTPAWFGEKRAESV
jgi:NADH:ubiquinone oxidoreductase subunit 6 (subunit J)